MRTSRTGTGVRIAATAAALALAAGACSSGDDEPRAAGEDNPIFLGVQSSAPTLLQEGQSCDEVLDDFQTVAPAVFEGAFSGDDGVVFAPTAGSLGAVDQAESTFDAASPASGAVGGDGAASGRAVAGESSDTNTQEEGIDEPDTVENDGEFVYLVDQQELVILDGATAEVLSRTPLATWGAQILLQDDRLLALSGDGGGGFIGGPMPMIDDVAAVEAEISQVAGDPIDPDEEPTPDEPIPVEPLPLPVEPAPFHAGTIIQLIDVSDRTAPEIVETTEIEGHHVDTRVVDGVARVVVSTYPQPQPLFEGDGASIEQRVADTSLDDWLPAFRTTTLEGDAPTSIEGSLVECEDVLVPEVNAGITETSVLRVDFDEGFDPAHTTTVVAEASTVYASASTLYVAATRWVQPDAQRSVVSDEWSTALHAFDLGGDGAAAHLAAGEVPGSTLNQFSLSEHDGHLRIATTEGVPWGGGAESESGVHVFERRGSELVEVGSVGGLGKTETIQSVRFMGPVGYVVTFRQTDPLYVIDLSDPSDPRNVGELKIPGFSSYLHPIGEDRLIGVGRDADLEGRDTGFLVSLFDVSDPTAPKQIQTHIERDAWSAAGNDPQAFLWWAPESAAIMPIERYREPTPNEPEGFGAGITILDVADSGITERATVSVGGRYASRAIVVQDRLWSLFEGGVAVSDFDDPADAEFHGFR